MLNFCIPKSSFFLLIIVFASFFWDDGDKEVKNLHKAAEAAMQSCDLPAAKEAYQALLKKISTWGTQKYLVDWQTYCDISMRLAEVHESLEEREEGEKVLGDLLSQKPPPHFIPHIQLLQARLTAGQNSPEKAYKLMQSTATLLPFEKWRSDELSFFHALEFVLDEHYGEMLLRAKRYFTAGFYENAISFYEEVLKAIEEGNFPKARSKSSLIQKQVQYRIAECHYYLSNIEKTLSLIEVDHEPTDQIGREKIFLAALCYKAKQEYEKALEQFQSYVNSNDRGALEHYDHALFEIGLCFYNSKNLLKAKSYFENLQKLPGKRGKTALVAAAYLARIYLEEKNAKQVEPLLAPVTYSLATDDPLKYELFYLRGLAAYQLEEFSAARDFFERALPARRSGGWILQARYYLGLSYMKLGDDPRKGKELRGSFFRKSEETFKKLLHTSESEAAFLALARLYLIEDRHFNTFKRREIADLLRKNQSHFSKEGTLEALILCATAEDEFQEKENIYEIATDGNFQSCFAFGEAWFARGLNYFQKGLQGEEGYFEKASSALETAFRFLEKKDEKRAAQTLKLEAKANFYRNSQISSIACLEKLVHQFTEKGEDHEETLYLKGLIASQLTDLYFLPTAEDTLNKVVACYPHGKYANKSLYVLGMLYYRQENFKSAKEKFLELTSHYPDSDYAGEGWFWAAEAAEKLDERDPEIKIYRRHVYTLYPNTPHAPDAYFRQFAYSEYLDAHIEALAHLKKFPLFFPKAPQLTLSFYLLGKAAPHFEEAKEAFEEAIRAFHVSLKEEKIPEASFIYFRYQAMLELATLSLKHNREIENAIDSLKKILEDFSETDHPLTSLLKQKTPYPSLYEESEFALAKCYLKMGKIIQAQEVFESMLSHYQKAGIQYGAYLSKVWQEQGKLILTCKDFETAIHCFKIAEECGEGYLSDDQRLSLWILESDCYKSAGELDLSMRMLSKAINESVSSPLRLKAMFLRAEIYEMQGRPELAIRQLEAMSKKGGEWALKAQEKLRSRYGVE